MAARSSLVLATVLLLAGFSTVPLGSAGSAELLPAPLNEELGDRWIVSFHDLHAADLGDGEWQGHEVVSVNAPISFAVVEVEDPATFHAQDRYRDNVRYVEHDDPTAFQTSFTPDDPRFDEQYGFGQIEAPTAWDTTLGNDNALVAVVDTGIYDEHEDLQGTVAKQYDFVNDDPEADDVCGHGTHVAGTVAANTDNGIGVAGTAQVDLLVAKALSSSLVTCSGSASDIADAITWSADNGADVISMSFGGSESDTIGRAIEYAWGQGAALFGAAGNSGDCTDCVGYPAARPQVAAVTCTNSSEEQCSFSSQGPESEVAAPGNDILSTYDDGGYTEMSGTSMSTPHVSGVAGLMLSVNPELTNSEIRATMNDTAQDLGASGHDNVFGHGEVDAAAAVAAANEGNLAPDAAFTSTCPDLNCTFDASASEDPDGAITAYDWDLGDGSTASGETVEHTYDEPGTYTVELTATDDENATDTANDTVDVSKDTSYFHEEFDDGSADGFTLTGLWHVDEACADPPTAPNSLAYHDAGSCSYDTGEANSGEARFDVDLSAASEATLTFDHRWETEDTSCGLFGCSEYDVMTLEAREAGGSWDELDRWTGLDDDQLSWTEATYDLSAYAGGVAEIRYTFDTVDSVDNDHEGWFVDNVDVS